MSEELKPCPFCGGTPRLVDLGGWELLCDCPAFTSDDKDVLIESWNRRAAPQPQREADEPRVTLSCGCRSHHLGFPAQWKSQDREGDDCTMYGSVCEKHFYEYEAEPAQYDRALPAQPSAFVAVPKMAIDWLMGAGPSPLDGTWFQRPLDAPPFWWRKEFRAMLAASEGKP